MFINRYLRLFYEEYKNFKTINMLLDFTNKTLPQDGTDKIFIGCVLIMFNKGIDVNCSNLLSIAKSGIEKIGSTNLLNFYIKRINDNSLVAKYLNNIDKDIEYDKHINLVIEYLEQFGGYDFAHDLKESYDKKIKQFLEKDGK